MLHIVRTICATALVGLAATASAVPQISVWNDRAYRATSGTSFDFRGGELVFVLYDGNAFSSVECPFVNIGTEPDPITGLFPSPLFPGSIPCPAGHNAFITTRFGDRSDDVRNLWGRLGSVEEATRVPSRVPELIRFVAGPLTDLPRPSNDFVDRSTLVLHDLQSASFREKDVTRYQMYREYLVSDADTNGDGVLSALERTRSKLAADSEEIRHMRETIIYTGNTNGYLFTYPIRPWIELNKDLDPSLAPRSEIAVNQLNIIEAFPGISNRAGITNTRVGFFFKNLTNFGTDYDGDPALLIDYRVPGSIAWDGNNFSNLISGLDNAFFKVFERRFNAAGSPVAYAGTGEIAMTAITLGANPGDPVIISAAAHGLEDAEEIQIYRTGYSDLDGQRFYVNLQSDFVGFDATDQFEIFTDEGLNDPLSLDVIPDGTLGFIDPTAGGAANVPDITITVGTPAVVTTLAPHGLADGDSITLEDTGLTPFNGPLLFVGNSTATTFELFTDAALTAPFAYLAFPDPTALVDSAVLGTATNDFEFPIWPFPFVDQNFGGQLLLPSVYDKGYEFPDAAFRLFFGTAFGAQNLAILADDARPRNDLIMRLRFLRNGLATSVSGGSALLPGDLSQRDFELELCLVDSFEGATKSIADALAGKSSKSGKSGAKSEEVGFGVDDDLDGDGQSNLFEFAFDANGGFDDASPAMADASAQIAAQVSVEINPETSLCELTIKKRPGVREYLEYYFEEVAFDGTAVEIDPTNPENTQWTLVKDGNLEYKVVSSQPISGSSFFRACARKNTFGIEITE